MSRFFVIPALSAVIFLALVGNIHAQAPQQNPVSFNFDGGFALQSNADLDEGEGGLSHAGQRQPL